MKGVKSRPKIVIGTGFDRCGSSMVSRLLAKHPGVNLLFQPFNSSEIHQAQWEVWPPSKTSPKTEKFLEKLLDGRLDKDYIASDWFFKYSSSLDIKPDQVNLIKDTKCHFKFEWLNAKFPEIEFFGIWRDPRGITCSLMRNDFNKTWYGDISVERINTIISQSPLLEEFGDFLTGGMSELERMAVIVAIRTRLLLGGIPRGQWLLFEKIAEDPPLGLGPFLNYFGLAPLELGEDIKKDYNVSGKPPVTPDLWKDYFSGEEKRRLDKIFLPVLKLAPTCEVPGKKVEGE